MRTVLVMVWDMKTTAIEFDYEKADRAQQAHLRGEELPSEPESLPLATRLFNARNYAREAVSKLERGRTAYTGERLPKKYDAEIARLVASIEKLCIELHDAEDACNE